VIRLGASRAVHPALIVWLAISPTSCKRPQPCEGERCGGHGDCRVVRAEASGPGGGSFERHVHYRRAETCDCDGEDGFIYREVGCGPASAVKTCLPYHCEDIGEDGKQIKGRTPAEDEDVQHGFARRCNRTEACFPRGLYQPPDCGECPPGLQPSADQLDCLHPECLDGGVRCSEGLACGEDGECAACPEGQAVDEELGRCRPCPDGFEAIDGRCSPLYGRAYLMTKMQINAHNPPEVVGQLNDQETLRGLWNEASADGYNMIWDEDLVLIYFFPEFPDGKPPPEPVETDLYVYESNFGVRPMWEHVHGKTEPDGYRDPKRSRRPENYLPEGLAGEECARSVTDCNPAYFNGDGIFVEKHETTPDCSPALARLRVEFGPEGITTVVRNWLLIPYPKYGTLLNAQDLELNLKRKPTGLCDEGDPNQGWPCTSYVGWIRATVRHYEIFQAIQNYQGGGLREDVILLVIGDPDVDLDGDGEADSFTVQFDMDLTPVVYAASLDTATTE
jgi:hypothetical protein